MLLWLACVPQIACSTPTLGGTLGNCFHFTLGVCYAALFAYLFDLIIPLHWYSTLIFLGLFPILIIYAAIHPLATKVCVDPDAHPVAPLTCAGRCVHSWAWLPMPSSSSRAWWSPRWP